MLEVHVLSRHDGNAPFAYSVHLPWKPVNLDLFMEVTMAFSRQNGEWWPTVWPPVNTTLDTDAWGNKVPHNGLWVLFRTKDYAERFARVADPVRM